MKITVVYILGHPWSCEGEREREKERERQREREREREVKKTHRFWFHSTQDVEILYLLEVLVI